MLESMSNRQAVLIVLGVAAIMFLYMERIVLIPFILAALFAYIFNPVVNRIARSFNLHRIISIAIIYFILASLIGAFLVIVGGRLLAEVREVTAAGAIDTTAQNAINSLPDWNISGTQIGLKSSAYNLLSSFKDSVSHYQNRTGPIFTSAIGQSVYVLVFFVAGFYILKDWAKMHQYLRDLFPKKQRETFNLLWSRINVILGNYLRGQLILVVIMTAMTFAVLEILGVRYALILAVMTGFLEIIPYVGPITAAIIAGGVAFLNGQNRFDLDPTYLALIILGSYFVLRHVEDYFVIPQVYNRLTKLHPLVIIFSVLAGGHLFGLLGLVLAVPIAATVKILLEFFTQKT